MYKIWRTVIRKFHPEGIPAPGARLYNLLSGSGIFLKHYDLVARDIARYCREGRLLDVGTGPGKLLLAIRSVLPRMQLAGIDISPSMIEKARKNISGSGNCGDIELVVGSAVKLPYPDNSLDCVVSTGSIHHWKQIAKGLTEIHRVLKKGRYALIYDLVQKLPEDISGRVAAEFGRFRLVLLWLHSFEEPFYSVKEMEALAAQTPFRSGEVHFAGALCCLVMKKK